MTFSIFEIEFSPTEIALSLTLVILTSLILTVDPLRSIASAPVEEPIFLKFELKISTLLKSKSRASDLVFLTLRFLIFLVV